MAADIRIGDADGGGHDDSLRRSAPDTPVVDKRLKTLKTLGMFVENIAFHEFQSFTGHTESPRDDGCGWFATADRQILGRIYLDADRAEFCLSVLRRTNSGWKEKQLGDGFAGYDEAEAVLTSYLRNGRNAKVVVVTETPLRLRFGRGQRADADLT